MSTLLNDELAAVDASQPQPAAQQPAQPQPRTYDEVPASTYQDERQDYRDEREGYEYEGSYWPTYDQQPGRR